MKARVPTLDLRERIRDVPDFPTEGVVFKDLMPLIADPEYFTETIDRLADWSRPREPALILGAEARGFIFGAALAYALGAGFIAARKPGKLPPVPPSASSFHTSASTVPMTAGPCGSITNVAWSR